MTTIFPPLVTATALLLGTLAAGCTDYAPLDTLAADMSTSSTNAASSSEGSGAPTTEPSGPTTTDPTTGASSETGTASPCPPEHICVPAVAGWAGPFVAREPGDGLEIACSSPFPDHFVTLHADLDAPPAVCTCECDPEGTPGCDPVTALEQYEGNVCAGPPDSWNISSSCNSAVAAGPGTAIYAEEVEVTNVSCQPSRTEDVPPATFDRTIVFCAPPPGPAESCGDASECVPALDLRAEELCLVREGDVPCPETWPDNRHVYYADIDDDRGCDDCSCSEFSGTCTGVTIVVFGSNDCSGNPVGGVTPGTCETLDNQGASSGRRTGTGTPQVDCSGNAVGGLPVGSAEPSGPFTACCLAQ